MKTCDNNIAVARDILETCLNAVGDNPNDYTFTELKELLAEILENTESDYYNDSLKGGEVRLIHERAIDEIWTDSLIELIKDCYDLSNVPTFVSIDWGQTAENCKVDGMGHHFASYDGEEYESGVWHIFRTN